MSAIDKNILSLVTHCNHQGDNRRFSLHQSPGVPCPAHVIRPSESRTESRSASRFTGRRVHFIGIGGSGMSGLARMLLESGAIVTGSETKPNQQTFELSAARRMHLAATSWANCFRARSIWSSAPPPSLTTISKSKPPRRTASNTIKYAEMLGEVMAERFGVAVAGTHGKSTTTAMIAFALHECGADPSFVVGGTVPQLGNAGSRSGASPLFIAEACEYDRSFHHLRPTVAMITNIEEDHLDCYKDIYQIIESFRTFVRSGSRKMA